MGIINLQPVKKFTKYDSSTNYSIFNVGNKSRKKKVNEMKKYQHDLKDL